MSLDELERSAPDVTEEPVLRPPTEFPEKKTQQPPPEKAKRWYRRPLRLLLVIIIAGALVTGGVVWWLQARQWESTDDAFIDVHMVMIAPQVAGRVSRVLVDDNQKVAAGQLLVEARSSDFSGTARPGGSQSRSSGRAAWHKPMRSKPSPLPMRRKLVPKSVSPRPMRRMRTRQLQRTQPLVERQFASRQQLDNDLANARSTAVESRCEPRKKLASTEAQLRAAASQIDTAKANLRSAEAQEEQARLEPRLHASDAPEAGRVAHKNVAGGDYVQVGQNLMALVPLNVWVTANFKETQLDHMRVGQPVEIRIDAYPDKVFHGHIDSFEAGSGTAFAILPPENATGNYVKVVQRVPVKIVFDSRPIRISRSGPGMSVVPSVKLL